MIVRHRFKHDLKFKKKAYNRLELHLHWKIFFYLYEKSIDLFIDFDQTLNNFLARNTEQNYE